MKQTPWEVGASAGWILCTSSHTVVRDDLNMILPFLTRSSNQCVPSSLIEIVCFPLPHALYTHPGQFRPPYTRICGEECETPKHVVVFLLLLLSLSADIVFSSLSQISCFYHFFCQTIPQGQGTVFVCIFFRRLVSPLIPQAAGPLVSCSSTY
jgi:hypothetical protein